MTYDYSKELIDDYEKLLDIDKGHDVIIYAGENENAKEIRAHSIILCIRSQYFRAAFSNEWADKKDGKFILKKSNISPHIFEIILRFIYCGKVNLAKLAKLQTRELLELLIAVDELNIQTLITCIQEYLIDHHYRILHHNPIEALETVYQLDTFSGLLDFFLEAICDRPEILFNTDNLIRLRAPLLESLLKRDDLLLDEIVIWDNLISWSFAQHPSIQRDIDKWNKEEIAVMKTEVGYSNGQISIGCYRSYGPIFGYYLVYLGTNWWVYYGYSGNYPSIKIQILSSSGNIDIDDYEVFQVIKK
ncbi:unnamed protein product [Rhizophagus irregularis]|nr:unnamed protein product [Rhizophagus irregularis]